MEEKNTKITFELSDLSYKELLTAYKEINDFIEYLNKLKKDIEIDEGDKKLWWILKNILLMI